MSKRKTKKAQEDQMPPVAPDNGAVETTVSNVSKDDSLDIADAGKAPAKAEPSPVLRITSEEQAIALVKENYTVPANSPVVFVTEDRNVFWKQNEGAAVSHAQRNNLKLFRLKWD